MFRRIAVAGCCAGAFGVVALQALIGFPMEREIKKSMEQLKGLPGGGIPGGGFLAPPGAGGKGKTDAKTDPKDMEMFLVFRGSSRST